MMPPQKPKRSPNAGVTLIEMMIALALFALIGSAGFAMLDQVLRSQRGSEGRLERLSEQQRALHVIMADFQMATSRSLQATDATVSLDRNGRNASLHLRYHLAEGVLHREVGDIDGTALADQAILTGVKGISWRFLTPEGVWFDAWPKDTAQTLNAPPNPRAIDLVISLQGQAGNLRRVAPLPVDPE